MDIESWITDQIHAFEFYGGVTRIIVPDNFKDGVTNSSRTNPIINQGYREMAEYYNTTIIPECIRHPKDYYDVFVIPNI